jgi:hypothetical protein
MFDILLLGRLVGAWRGGVFSAGAAAVAVLGVAGGLALSFAGHRFCLAPLRRLLPRWLKLFCYRGAPSGWPGRGLQWRRARW